MTSETDKPRWASRRLGLLVRRRREEMGWSQEDLAGILGQYGVRWYQSTVNRVESGGRTVSWDEAIVICAALEIDLVEAAQGDLDHATAVRRRAEARKQSLEQQLRDSHAELAVAVKQEQEARVRALADAPEHMTARELRAIGMGAMTANEVRQANRTPQKRK
jgi:transcriptional regulator with XRE-family HTH domain